MESCDLRWPFVRCCAQVVQGPFATALELTGDDRQAHYLRAGDGPGASMATIEVAYAGEKPGEVLAELRLEDAVRVLEPDRRWLGDLSRPPSAPPSGLRDPRVAGYQEVLVGIGADEARRPWKPGYYRSALSPAEALFRLQVHQRLGPRWRDEWKKGEDADGDPAIWLWAVLRAEAPEVEWAWENRERIRAEVREAAADARIPDWVFVRFRMEKEDAAVS